MKQNEAPERIWINPANDLPKISGHIDKDSTEYTRTDAFMKKAKSWFIQQHTGMWNEFKNYMKGENI